MAFFRRTPKESAAPVEERTLLPGGLFAPSSLDWMVGASQAGVSVTTSSALENVAVWACQRVLVATISMLPVDVFRENSAHVKVTPQPQVVRSPSGRVSRRGWVAQNVRALVGSGNMYGRVVDTDALGRVRQLETILPDTVNWTTIDNEEVPMINQKRQTLWPLGDFWHIPASQFLMPGSRVAMNPTDFAKTSIGTGLAAERFGANFFRDGVSPNAVAKVNHPIVPEQAQIIKQGILAATRNNREPLVVGSDIDITPWGAKLTDSQFIELLQFEVLQACRVYGVPPSMVYAAISGQNVTYANIGQADMQYLKYSVAGWLIDLEDAWSDLIAVPHSVRFDVDALLRMDAMERATLNDIRLKSRTRTINEVRVDEGEDPFADPIYDEPGIPGGQETVGQLMRGLTPAVGVYLTEDEARKAVTDAGIDLPPLGPDAFAKPVQQQLPLAMPAMSGTNSARSEVTPVNVYAVLPEQRDQLAPQVTVNVQPTPVENTINVAPTPVTVENNTTVQPAPAAPAQVTVLPEDGNAEITFKRDPQGRIISAKKRTD